MLLNLRALGCARWERACGSWSRWRTWPSQSAVVGMQAGRELERRRGYQIGSTYPSLSMSVEFHDIAREKKIARF